MNKKENEIRKLLGNRYHLYTSYRIDLEEPEEWKLYKKYDDPLMYFSVLNQPIMTSKKNSFDELYEFAKKHHEIDEHHFMGLLNVIVAWFAMIIIIINIFIQDETIRGFTFGIDFMIIIYGLVSLKIYKKNHKIKMLEQVENFKKWYKGE